MAKLLVSNLSYFYGKKLALRAINLASSENEILSIIGPANSGKTTFLRLLNRLNDTISDTKMEGKIFIDGKDIYGKDIDVTDLRRKVGMVFAVPLPLPFSIWENCAFGLKLRNIKDASKLHMIVENSLKLSALWDEVKDRLNKPAATLSGGQQQRLCLARIIALEPEILLLDEPCSGLDPISTYKIEETVRFLKSRYTIIFVTNNTKQAARVSDTTAFFLEGELVELAPTSKIFTNPSDPRTNDYITGKFG